VPGSDFLSDRPYRNKRRLTNRERQEVEEWERTTKNMYECGHRKGILVEFWPGDIIYLGYLIDHVFQDKANIFKVFSKVGDWRCYEDELLLICQDEAGVWLLESDEIRHGLNGMGNLTPQEMRKLIVEFHRSEVGIRSDLERRLDKVAKEMSFAPVVGMKRNIAEGPSQPDIEATIGKIGKALTDATTLCKTSIETGNPIRLLW